MGKRKPDAFRWLVSLLADVLALIVGMYPAQLSGWHLVEGNDGVALSQHMDKWANLLELQISPVIEDAEAASGFSGAQRSAKFRVPFLPSPKAERTASRP